MYPCAKCGKDKDLRVNQQCVEDKNPVNLRQKWEADKVCTFCPVCYPQYVSTKPPTLF